MVLLEFGLKWIDRKFKVYGFASFERLSWCVLYAVKYTYNQEMNLT